MNEGFFNSACNSLVRPVNTVPEGIFPDFTVSGNAEEIHKGIRETISGIRLSILAMGMGLAKMKANHLYLDLGCNTMGRYIRRLCDETKMDRSSIFNWLCIGESYLKYKNDLETVGFNDGDGPTKLPYLERALKKNQKREVFSNIKRMSLREFIMFSKGDTAQGAAAQGGIAKAAAADPVLIVSSRKICIGGKSVIRVKAKIDKKTYAYLKKVLTIAVKAMRNGEVLFPVRLKDMDELQHFENASRQLIYRLRKKWG